MCGILWVLHYGDCLDFFIFLWTVLVFLSWKAINLIWFSNWKLLPHLWHLKSQFNFLILMHDSETWAEFIHVAWAPPSLALLLSGLLVISLWQWLPWAVFYFSYQKDYGFSTKASTFHLYSQIAKTRNSQYTISFI